MSDVFISYKRDERAECERIAEKLKHLGLDVWFDARLTAGDSFTAEIEREVRRAKAVLVLWSPGSVESRWVRNEADIGMERGVLCAAQIKPCTVPINFRDVHYEPIPAGFGDDHPNWIKLLERIGALTGRPGLAGYARALGQAGRPLEAWASAHPDDPLANKAADLVARLAGETPTSVGRRGLNAGAVAAAALVALAIGAGAAWSLKPAGAAPAPSAQETALTLVGRWNEVGLGDCEAGALIVSIEPGGLALSDSSFRDGRAIVDVEDGWVRLGDGTMLKRDGANMLMKSRADAAETEFTPCG